MKHVLPFMLILVFACNTSNKQNEIEFLSKDNLSQVHGFVEKLNVAIHNYDYDFLLSSWSHALFRKRVRNLNYTERGVFDHIYDLQLSKDIENTNIELINQIRHSNGKLTHLKTNVVDGNHAEITYLMELDTRFYFFKYRLEMLDNQPKLSDIYFIKEDKWMSDGIKEIVRLNTRYKAMSTNRYDANRSYYDYETALSKGDTLEAFMQLNNIPKSHQISNKIRISRINLASQLNDSIFNQVIDQELEVNQNIYIDYLISFYLNDSIRNMESSLRISREMGISRKLLDSLNEKRVYWN